MDQDYSSKVAQLLYQTFTAVENTQRAEAEKSLQALAADTQNFFMALITLIGSDNPQYESGLKISAATSLRQFVRQLMERTQLEVPTRIQFGEQIFQLLTSDKLTKEVKNLLGFALHPLLTIDQSAGSTQCIQHFMPIINASLEGAVPSVIGGLRAIRSIFSGICQHAVINAYSETLCSGLFVNIAQKAWTQVGLGLQRQDEATVLEAAELLNDWATTMTNVLEYFELTSNALIVRFASSFEMATAFSTAIRLKLPDPLLASPDSIINLSSTAAHKQLNLAKSQLFQCFNIIIQYLMDQKQKLTENTGQVAQRTLCLVGVDIPDSPFTLAAAGLVIELINSLLIICNTTDLEAALLPEQNSELIVEILILLHKLSSEQRFFPAFADTYRTFIVNVLFVLLRLSTSEFDNYENSPQEFVSFSIDVCERQESEVIKTCVAQLLESICQHIDGALTFVIYFVAQTLDLTITQQDLATSTQYEYLTEWAATSRFLHSKPEIRLEASITIISILSFLLPKRRDLITLIERCLVLHAERLLQANDGVVMCRICMLLYFFTEHLFEKDQASFSNYLTFLLNCTNPKTVPQAVAIQASETLSYLVQEETLLFKLEAYIDKVMLAMVFVIDSTKEKTFFEALHEVVQTYTEKITPEILVALVNAIANKVIAEQVILTGKSESKKDKMVMHKCWNIIRTLVDSREIVPTYRDQIEQLLVPLFDYMQNPTACDFDGEILLVLQSLLKKCETVTQINMSLVSTFPKVQEKYENGLGHMFLAMSYFLHYGKDVLTAQPASLVVIADMAMKALFARPKQRHNEAVMGEGALLLQQLLLTFPGLLDEKHGEIVGQIVQRMQSEMVTKFFWVRLLGAVLASFHYNINSTCTVLSSIQVNEQQTALMFVIQQILVHAPDFVLDHDKKLATVGICKLIQLEQMPTEIVQMLGHVFKALIWILNAGKQQKQDQATGTTETNQPPSRFNVMEYLMDEMGDADFDSLGDDQFASLSRQLVSGSSPSKELKNMENESASAVNHFLTPLKFFDEFDHFRSVITGIQQRSAQALQTLVGYLNAEEQALLMKFLQTKRVQVGLNQSSMEDRRIVRPIHLAKKK